jgi:hypothetical protein
VNNKYNEPSKLILVGWVSKTLNQAHQKFITLGFKTINIRSFNLKAMDEKISYNNIYTIFNANKEEGDEKVSNEKIPPSNGKKHCTTI